MIKRLDDLFKQDGKKMTLAVVASQDKEVLMAVIDSYKLGIIDPVLIGDRQTKDILEELGVSGELFSFIEEADLVKAAEIGVRMVSTGEADFIMKGLVDTSILLKAVLNKEWGLRSDSQLSHVMIYETDSYHKLIYLTDGGMNIAPSYQEKIKIIENAIGVAKALGNDKVKVALLAAKEKVDEKMPATIDARLIMESNSFAQEVIVDGPMALDLAISNKAAEIKGYKSEVAGDADILLVPNIEVGNGIGKSITYFAKGKSAGIIMGARVPIVLTSRADDHITKLYSIALGSCITKSHKYYENP